MQYVRIMVLKKGAPTPRALLMDEAYFVRKIYAKYNISYGAKYFTHLVESLFLLLLVQMSIYL